MGLEQCQTSTAHMDDVMPNSAMSDEQFRQMAEQYVDSLSSTALSSEAASLLGSECRSDVGARNVSGIY